MKGGIFTQPESGALKRKQELHIKIMRVSSLDAITYFPRSPDHRIQFKNTFLSFFIRRFSKIVKSDYQLFHETQYLRIFRNSVEKIQSLITI